MSDGRTGDKSQFSIEEIICQSLAIAARDCLFIKAVTLSDPDYDRLAAELGALVCYVADQAGYGIYYNGPAGKVSIYRENT